MQREHVSASGFTIVQENDAVYLVHKRDPRALLGWITEDALPERTGGPLFRFEPALPSPKIGKDTWRAASSAAGKWLYSDPQATRDCAGLQ